MTTIPAAQAKKLNLPLPQQPIAGAVISPTNLTFRSGLLRARILGTDATEYVFPCFFVGDPAGPIPVDPFGDAVPNLLGLTGVINQLSLTFDGDPSPTAPYGNLIVEKI
ncbi:MAG TPA: hypothetical protein VE988_19470 [Gemmataceae bacterium]|nr:hypothetical protein [Gemmataceae bacterium]